MPTRSDNHPKIVIDLLQAIHLRTKHRTPPSWTAVNPCMAMIDCRDNIKCDRAILYALQQNWISVNPSLPIHSLALTRYGADQIGQGPM